MHIYNTALLITVARWCLCNGTGMSKELEFKSRTVHSFVHTKKCRNRNGPKRVQRLRRSSCTLVENILVPLKIGTFLYFIVCIF